ncbi:junctional sarcoplasmic reticulum protein 1 [Dendrobates tinctorius]|uniref:junctional sarcoplasmic reticulum protein 1 n=1 Tax=Dendrobates tinctorius TaxID=92724 RepID=UPI003CC9C0C5
MKKKPEPKSAGAVRDEEFSPWNGITLNRCLVVAAVAALLSMGFQVLQDAVDDDLADVEAEAWTPTDQANELSEPWFFEAWFGSSEPELPEDEQPDPPDIEEPDVPKLEESEMPAVEEQELTSEEEDEKISVEEKDETISVEEDLVTKDQPTYEETALRKDSQKPTGQWGLKPKSKYMESKIGKIRIASEDGSQKRDIFPFHKKPKEPIKSFADAEGKSYKEKSYLKKYDEKKHDYSKKQDFIGKSYRKENEEHHKYLKQDKGRKENKDSKGYKQYHQEKDYKRKHDSRHYG